MKSSKLIFIPSKTTINNSLYLGQKIKMHGYSFSRAKLEEKRVIRGTDYAQGHTYEDVFSAKSMLLCLLSFKHFLTHVKKF